MSLKSTEILGYLGILIFVLVFLYLVLKLIGVFHSPSLEEILLATVVGQIFYSGYTQRALKDMDRRLEKIEKKLKI